MTATGNRNWYGDIQCFAGVAPAPRTEAQVQAILRDATSHPSPVRPMGSRHSVTPCMAARAPGGGERWGTAIDMRQMTGALRLDRHGGETTVTVPAGRTFHDVAHELREAHGLQFRVNTELGSLTMGAAACGGTKDSSFPGEFGQVCSDVLALRLVQPDGKVRELQPGDPDLVLVRGSYGLLGVATEVTYRVVPHQYIDIEHKEIALEDFEARSPEWLDGRTAVFLYLFPYAGRGGKIVAELRRKAGATGDERCVRLAVRNHVWREGLPAAAHGADQLDLEKLRRLQLESTEWLLRKAIAATDMHRVSPVDQIVDFERGGKKFAFSMWAFNAGGFARVLGEYVRFCREHPYRTSLPHVSYHIAKDRSSLLSYSWDGDVWTLDPVSTGVEQGWHPFLQRFNDRCVAWGGVPLFNQTPHLEPRHLPGFGARLAEFAQARRRFDPQDRMLNDYFARLL